MPQVGDISETELFNRVARECKLTRFGLDCYAYALLALGQIDLVIEAGEGGQVIAAGDPEVHAAAIKLLNN